MHSSNLPVDVQPELWWTMTFPIDQALLSGVQMHNTVMHTCLLHVISFAAIAPARTTQVPSVSQSPCTQVKILTTLATKCLQQVSVCFDTTSL
jgi:hypothetical protein